MLYLPLVSYIEKLVPPYKFCLQNIWTKSFVFIMPPDIDILLGTNRDIYLQCLTTATITPNQLGPRPTPSDLDGRYGPSPSGIRCSSCFLSDGRQFIGSNPLQKINK